VLNNSHYFLLENLMNFLSAEWTFYQRACQLLKDNETDKAKFFALLKEKQQVAQEQKVQEIQEHLTDYQKKGSRMRITTVRQGYLFVRSQRGRWKRRWVSIINGQLIYYKSWKHLTPIDIFDLKLCSVKPFPEKNFCFEVISHTNKTLALAASDATEMNRWIATIEEIISAQLGSDDVNLSPDSANGNSPYQQIISVPGNNICADCSGHDPQWVSLAYGVVICIQCSGPHRSLGAHISKVRSLRLDSWEPELLLMIQSIGNVAANAIFEKNLPENLKLTPNATADERLRFIRAKYVEREWVEKDPTLLDTAKKFFSRKNINFDAPTLLKYLAQGLDVNWMCPTAQSRSLLHLSVLNENIECIELLVQHGANVNITDQSYNTPLHIAAQKDSTVCARLLLQHGARTDIGNNSGLTPYQVAVENSATGCMSLLEHESDDGDERDIPLAVSMTVERIPASSRDHSMAAKKRRSVQRAISPRTSQENDSSKTSPVARVRAVAPLREPPFSEPVTPQYFEPSEAKASSSSKRHVNQNIENLKLSHGRHSRSWENLEDIPSRTTPSHSSPPKTDSHRMQRQQQQRSSSGSLSVPDIVSSQKSIPLVDLPPPPPPIAQHFDTPSPNTQNNNNNIANKNIFTVSNSNSNITAPSDSKRSLTAPSSAKLTSSAKFSKAKSGPIQSFARPQAATASKPPASQK